MTSANEIFSVVALFIMFRETIEASIIVGVLLQFLARSKPALKRAVWWGVAGGVAVSILFGIIFIALYYTAQNNLFKGKNRDWFKGIISYIAAALITYLAFAMLRFLGWEEKWKRKLGAAIAAKVPDAIDKQDAAAAAATPGSSDTEASAPSAGARSNSKGVDDSPAQPSPRSPNALAKAERSSASSGGLSPLPLPCVSPDGKAPASAAGKADTAAACALAPADTSSLDDVEAPKDASDLNEAVAKAAVDTSPPTRRQFWRIWILVFTTVMREGIESVVFLGGLGNVKLKAVPLPAVVGIICGVLVGVFLFYTGKQVKDLKWLIITMVVIIFFIAAGQVSLGTDALMRAGLFGKCSPWYDERPWYMQPLYDWSHCCNDLDPTGEESTAEQNRRRFFALSRAIFGYQDKGTFLEIMLYCSYWIIVIAVILFKHWRGTLLDADWKYNRQQRKLAEEAAKREAEEAAAAEALEEAQQPQQPGAPALAQEAQEEAAVAGDKQAAAAGVAAGAAQLPEPGVDGKVANEGDVLLSVDGSAPEAQQQPAVAPAAVHAQPTERQ